MNIDCVICGKELTDESSVLRGIGPDCLKKLEFELESADGVDQTEYFDPGPNGDIWMKVAAGLRGGERYLVGIPRRYITQHSPTGLRWGYSGSGAAELALNVLIFISGDYGFADRHHQDFKREFVAAIQPEGGVIFRRMANDWVNARKATEVAKAKADAEELARQGEVQFPETAKPTTWPVSVNIDVWEGRTFKGVTRIVVEQDGTVTVNTDTVKPLHG